MRRTIGLGGTSGGRGAAVAALIALIGLAPGCGLMTPPTPVASVDVARYMGTWYEIAKYPVPFEEGLVGVTATYTLNDDGTVTVFNKGFEGSFDAAERTITGTATVANPATNAELSVSFFAGFGAPYWIIELDEDYQWAVVSDPFRFTLWILSRTPTLDAATYQEILSLIEAEGGYDLSRLEAMPQP